MSASASAKDKIKTSSSLVNYDMLVKTATLFRPKLIIDGASAYPRDFDYPRKRKIADTVGAFLMADMAHISELVGFLSEAQLGGEGGMIFFKKDPVLDIDLESSFNNAVFSGLQVVSNCRALAGLLIALAYELVSGGSDNHLVLVDLRPLVSCFYLSSCALVPGGIRIGSPTTTTRSYTEKEFVSVAEFIHEGVHINLEAKKVASGSKLQEFMKFVTSTSFLLTHKVSDLQKRVEALTPNSLYQVYELIIPLGNWQSLGAPEFN
ncbi:hypothetical protein ACH5RR_041314 [Cinchona calisaya]|uniref:Serine hydroxymethyltransferase-like domain-containing protein n=1 Tax=Cinchona calisaya TaxID=153742 RepID=A0ABD2XTF0_9GENT